MQIRQGLETTGVQGCEEHGGWILLWNKDVNRAGRSIETCLLRNGVRNCGIIATLYWGLNPARYTEGHVTGSLSFTRNIVNAWILRLWNWIALSSASGWSSTSSADMPRPRFPGLNSRKYHGLLVPRWATGAPDGIAVAG